MRKILALCLFVAVITTTIAFAESYPPLKKPGQPVPISTTFPAAIGSFQSSWQGTKSIYVFNGNGGALAAGDLVIWNNTVKTPVAVYDASAAGSGTYDTTTIADSIKTFKWYQVYVRFSNASNDSVVVQGLDSMNVAQADTFAFASGAGKTYSGLNFWRKVTLIYTIASNDSIEVVAYPYMTVKTINSTGSERIAGVIAGTYADDSLTKLDIEGIVDVKLAGATTEITPGAALMTHSTVKYGIPTTSSYPVFGYALGAGNTNTTYKCHINTMPNIKYAFIDSLLFVNGAKITNPHADTLLLTEAITKLSGDIKIMGNDAEFGNGAKITNGHADSLELAEAIVHTTGDLVIEGNDLEFGNGAVINNNHADSIHITETVLDLGATKVISDAEFTWHVSAFDFLFAASGVTHIAAEGCVHPTAAAEAIYAPLNIPFNTFGGTIVLDQITVYYNTVDAGDDFDFALIRTDQDGSLTIDEDHDDIGNGETGVQSATLLAADVTLADFAYHIECDVNNADAATDAKIYDILFEAHLE